MYVFIVLNECRLGDVFISASHHIHLAASVILVWLSAGFGYTKGAVI
jgi:hypothetical protein